MANFKVTRFVWSSDEAATIALVNNSFNEDGDVFDGAIAVDFPVFFDGKFVTAPAIVGTSSDANLVKAALDKIESTDTNATDKVAALKSEIAALPKRIWVRSLMKLSIYDVVDGDKVSTEKRFIGGSFAEKFRSQFRTNSHPTAAQLQDGTNKAHKKGSSSKKIVVKHNFFALNNKGKKYSVVAYYIQGDEPTATTDTDTANA